MTQNGAIGSGTQPGAIFRTSVGEFAFRPAEFGRRLEIKSGKVRHVLGVYETDDAAILALRNRQTGFQPWDSMGRNAVAIQMDTPQRWGRNGGAR
jgi:hypothetical protein